MDLSEVAGLNAVLGDYVTRCLYSKNWSLREAATTKVKLMLPQLEEDLEGSLPIICQVFDMCAL